MRLAKWLRFRWELTGENAAPDLELPEHYDIRPAVKGEATMVKTLVFNAFSLDNDWSDVFGDLKITLEKAVEDSFEGSHMNSLLLLHGNRAVGASVVSTDTDLPSQLRSGPVVLSEYRNRGWGSILLQASLIHLRSCGLTTAHGITKMNATAGKFVYPKFGGVSEPYLYETPVAD